MEHPREIVSRWMAEGRVHVSPAEAAGVLQCDPQSIRSAFKQFGKSAGFDGFMAGRNLRITVDSLARLVGGGEALIGWPGIKKCR